MASNQEKGRAKNLANFSQLCTSVSQLDAKYQPSNPALVAPALTAQYTAAKARLKTYNDVQGSYITVANNRKLSFATLGKLLTRVRRELKASGMPKEVQAEAMINLDQFINKFKGRRAGTASTTAAPQADNIDAGGGNTGADPISVAHLSCVQRANTLQEITSLLVTIPAYSPNIPELTLSSLNNLQETLSMHNEAVGQKIIFLDNARTALKQALDAPDTGLVDIALKVKDAIISTYGYNSPQYKQVGKLAFKREEQ